MLRQAKMKDQFHGQTEEYARREISQTIRGAISA